jgi:hypothetical protein
MGCFKVNSCEEMVAAYARIAPMLTPEFDPIFAQGSDMIAEQYLDGVEFDCDLMFCAGECQYSSISENWPTAEPYFCETGLHCPSLYPAERQAELVELCAATVAGLGFRSGAFHVECKYTSRGPRIIEVNARMGGTVVRDMNKAVWGVDFVDEHLFCAIGLPIRPTKAAAPLCGVSNIILFAPADGVLAPGCEGMLEQFRSDPRITFVHCDAEAGKACVTAKAGFPTVIGELALRSADVARAIEEIKELAPKVRVLYEPPAGHPTDRALVDITL